MEQSLARRSRLSRSADLPSSARSGFSLVELSIVLVILGLLTGGILTGQNLIRAAEIRSLVTQFTGFQAAAYQFRQKYFALPGDMTNATAFWGNADTGATGGQCAAPLTDTGTGTQTCNGNGDGILNNGSNEMFRYWQHLANAGLIEGAYTGVSGPGSNRRAIPGENTPLSRMGKAGWGLSNYNCCVGNNENFYFDYGNHLLFGADDGSLSNGAPVLTPKEAWVIDGKVDDGLAVSGRVISNVECTDAPNNNVTSANYLLGNTGILCHLKFTGVF
jgi:prepilin-type N-terminal cleavage/methylation domain-containing protein